MENKLIKIENGHVILDEFLTEELIKTELALKNLKEQKDTYVKLLQEAMEQSNVIKIDNDNLLINYIPESDREDFDKNKFRAEHQDLYDEYVKMTPVKAQVRIKVKK